MENSKSSSITFGSLLLLAFIILKLCKVIAWSWWWVLSPAWIPVAIAALFWFIGWAITKILWLTFSKEKREQLKALEKMQKGLDHPLKSKWQERMEQIEAQRKAK